MFSVANVLPLEHASCPQAVASNPADEKVYWTDLTFKHIARANLDGTNEEIIVPNVAHSLALVVDSYGGNIFFTDKVNKTVEVAKLDGSNRKVLIQNDTHEPVGLAIDSSRGYVILQRCLQYSLDIIHYNILYCTCILEYNEKYYNTNFTLSTTQKCQKLT